MDERRSANIVWHRGMVSREDRARLLGHKGATLWITGLPSSGKSTLAFALETMLIDRKVLAYVLDGDNIRHGLNHNLGFSPDDRTENIRRISEVAKLFVDSGVIVISGFISPYRADRDTARRLHDEAGLPFIEIFMDTPLEICERRDPKKLYHKARLGEIRGFTGIDAPYEPPENPDLIMQSARQTPEESAEAVIAYLTNQGILPDS